MLTRENSLKKRTVTEQDDLSKHIYDILTDAGSIKIKRVAKTLGLLVDHLGKCGILSEKDIEDILSEVVSSCDASPSRAQDLSKKPRPGDRGYTLS